MTEYWRLMAVNPNENSQIFQDRVDDIRIKAASFLGASADEIAITRNTTEGNTTLCQGLDLRQGDEILITAFEHASNRETWMRQAKRYGLVVKEVKFPIPPKNPESIVAAFERELTQQGRRRPLDRCVQPLRQLGPAHPSRALGRQDLLGELRAGHRRQPNRATWPGDLAALTGGTSSGQAASQASTSAALRSGGKTG